MWPYPQYTADSVTFTEEILSGKLHFLCSESRRSNTIFNYFGANPTPPKHTNMFLSTLNMYLPARLLLVSILSVLVSTEKISPLVPDAHFP